MNDEPTVTTLRRVMDAETRGRHLDPGVASTAWADAHAPRAHRIRTGLAVAATVIAVAGGAAAITLVRGKDSPTTAGGSSACTRNVSTTPLPIWARAGFSPAGANTLHVLGAKGEIVGVLFVTLRWHQPAGTNNKILWVAKDGYGSLHITAKLEGSNITATRTVDLGPSIVDLPAAGCWRVTLTWPGHSDTMALLYR